ncbi:MAG: hypothetical protein Q8N03_14445 [Ignavibacteria bacterium]|nr:hypothetical protein [Ignavibacteria bacterium]
MEHFKFFFTLFILFVFCGRINAQIYPDSTVHRLIVKGIDSIVDEDYESAERIFQTLHQFNKSLPIVDIYLAGTEIAKSFDYKIPFNEKKITYHLDRATVITDKLLLEDDKNIWHIYFRALTDGYRAYFNALRGNWLSAFSEGYNAVASFEKCLLIDTSFYDAYIAVGSYKYWRSRKTSFLSWLPFIKDEQDEGIQILSRAIKFSPYNSHLAYNSLIWIYIDRKEFKRAAELAETVLLQHPKSRFFKWSYARAVEEFDKEKANAVYYDIMSSYEVSSEQNRINEIVLKHKIAQNLVKLGKKKEASILLKNILSYKNLSTYESEVLKDRMNRVKSHLNELNKK